LCAALHHYRDGAVVLARADLSQIDQTFEGRRVVTLALLRKGLPEELVQTAMLSIFHYTLGYVFESQTETDISRLQFGQGLELILDGVEKKLTAH